MHKNNKTYLIFAIIIIVNLFLMLRGITTGSITLYIEIISAITAIVGIIAIWYQLKKDKDISEAQFVFELNNSFYQKEEMMNIFMMCYHDYHEDKFSRTFCKEEDYQISQYFSFFGVLNTFLEKSILDMEMIDRTFSYRYFLVANHPSIQEHLIRDMHYYRGTYRLYKHWTDYRKKMKLPIILGQNDLAKKNPDGFL